MTKRVFELFADQHVSCLAVEENYKFAGKMKKVCVPTREQKGISRSKI